MRNLLYRLASLLGDFNAIRRGPRATFKRVARKSAWRSASSILNKLFK